MYKLSVFQPFFHLFSELSKKRLLIIIFKVLAFFFLQCIFKGTFHARMGTIKNRDGKDLIEAEEIKNRWQEYTEELYKKGHNDLDNHNGVVTQTS